MSSKRSGYHNGNSGEVWIAGKKSELVTKVK